MPGFGGTAVFRRSNHRNRYSSVRFRSTQADVVTPQRGDVEEFTCGVGLALLLGGIVSLNPFAALGGAVMAGRNC